MLRRAAIVLVLAAAVAPFAARCGGPPCRAQTDCPLGYYCVLDLGGSGVPSGECKYDCASAEDCPGGEDGLVRPVCTNQGRCATIPRPPRLLLHEPETDTVYPEGTRSIRVSGEVETAAAAVTIAVRASGHGDCSGGPPREVLVENAAVGTFTRLPFVLDAVVLDSGRSTVVVEASVGGSKRSTSVEVEVACPGCAELHLDRPGRLSSVPELELPHLAGTVSPASSEAAIWRVYSHDGDVLDGLMPLTNGGFDAERLPLFAGLNRVEVVVTGVGAGLGESRCSALVSSGITREVGLRAILSWDAPSADLDLHVVGPGGRFGDPSSSLSSRGRRPYFGGVIEDDVLGYGPELARIEALPDGVYGLVVEPVLDGGDYGADALVRVLVDGRPVTAVPSGPAHLGARAGQLWIVGTLEVSDGAALWRPLDALVSAAVPPTTPPEDWPRYQ